MILSEIQAECGRLLGDPNNDRWSAAILLSRINLAQTEIQGYTNAVKTPENLTVVAATRTVSVDSDTMNIVRAVKNMPDGSIKPFNGITRDELDYLYPDWQQWQSGEPLYWFFDATNQQMNLIPIPDSNFATSGSLTIWGSLKPADLVDSTDVPFDNNTAMIHYHMSIVHWVVAHCFMDDGTDASLKKSKFHRSGSMLNPGQYEQELGRIMAEFDVEEAIPSRILWRPQGDRVGSLGFPSKSNPIPW